MQPQMGLNKALKYTGMSKCAWYYNPKPRKVKLNPDIVDAVSKISIERTHMERVGSALINRYIEALRNVSMVSVQGTNVQQNAVTAAKNVHLQSIVNANTVHVDFRVCCNHEENTHPCTIAINAIKKYFNNVVKIQATKPYDDAEDMCVIGTAIIKPSMKAQFEKDLKNKINKNEPSIKIKKSIVTFHQ